MQYIADYALLVLEERLNKADIKGLFDEIGAQRADDQIKGIIAALKGKGLSDVISERLKKSRRTLIRMRSWIKCSSLSSSAAKQEAPKPYQKAPKSEENVDMDDLLD